MTSKTIAALSLAAVLVTFVGACTTHGVVRMMPRDVGTVYSGVVTGNGNSGTMSVTIDEEVYSGPIVVTTANDSFGFIQQYGRVGPSFATVTATGGPRIVKGILSSPSGRGLRCEFSSNGGNGGGGVCVDDHSRVFDAVVTR